MFARPGDELGDGGDRRSRAGASRSRGGTPARRPGSGSASRYASASRTSVRSYSPSEPSTRCGIPARASARCSGSVAYPVRASARISLGGDPAGERVGDLRGTQFASANSLAKLRTRTGRRGRASRSAPSRPAARCGSRTGPRPRGSPRASGSSARARSARVTRMPLAEAEDVPRLGVAPAVDQLVVIAAHAQVPVRPGEQVDERRLRVAGVLELVGQQPSPPLTQPREPVRVLREQPHRAGEQVVELERVTAPQLASRSRATPRRSAARPDVAWSARSCPGDSSRSSRARSRRAPRRSPAVRSRRAPAGSRPRSASESSQSITRRMSAWS